MYINYSLKFTMIYILNDLFGTYLKNAKRMFL